MKVVQVRFPTIVLVVAIAFCLSLSGEAFAPPSPSSSSSSTLKIASLSRRYHHHESQPQPLENDLPEQPSNKNKNHLATTTAIWTTVATTLWTTAPGMAWANDSPDWGLFEGRTGSLIHPVVMGGLFLYSAYTAFLGFQWRRQRTMGDEITQVKADLAAVTPAAAAAEGEAPPVKTAAQVELETSLETLQQERKDLAAAKPRDKHFSQGSFLAFLGTAIAIEGCLNTFSRAGKLFPGPHLYGGAALVVLWGLAVATVPAMQKGNDTARTVHIAANLASLAFFAWQVSSGIPIMLKVVDLTSWP